MTAQIPKARAKRKPITKRLRFEIFKRDGFQCQYCGASSPDTVLHVDHINPVAGGGGNDIMNLITACASCNSGKGARALGDNSIIAKQKAQLDELNQRREQLEMMLKWREGLSELGEHEVDAFNSVFERATDCHLNEHGRAEVKIWLKRHKLSDLLDSLEASLSTYYKTGDPDPDENNRLAGEAFNMTIRVLNARSRYADRPYMKDLFYARACLRNRVYCNERVAIELLEQAYHLGAHIEELKEWAKNARNWTIWKTDMIEWISEMSAENEGCQSE